VTYEEKIEAMAEAMWQAENVRMMGRPRLVEWAEAGEQQHIHWRASARAAAESIGLRETERPRLSDSEIAQVLVGVREQVEWNGWEEPFVTNRFKSELKTIFASKQLENNGDRA
jgi:hypothetical protein